MSFNFTSITRGVSRALLLVQKASPEILTGAGVVGLVGTAVLASKATLEFSSEVQHIQKNFSDVAKARETYDIETYPMNVYARDLVIGSVDATRRFFKAYGPTLVVGALSIAAIVGSTRILKSRNLALAGAYAALETAYDKYRKRVREVVGDTIADEISSGVTKARLEYMEDGKTVGEKDAIEVDPEVRSQYSRVFDHRSKRHTPDKHQNAFFLRCEQDWLNRQLKYRGHVFLNEVYDRLGLPRSTAGQLVGWIYDPEDPTRDNYIDFSTWDDQIIFDNGRAVTFNDVYDDNVFVLDFNVDGVIHELI